MEESFVERRHLSSDFGFSLSLSFTLFTAINGVFKVLWPLNGLGLLRILSSCILKLGHVMMDVKGRQIFRPTREVPLPQHG